MEDPKLITLAEFQKMSPRTQGYIAYMQADWPGSELKGHDNNPYPTGSADWKAWRVGESLAVQVAQDSEE